MWSFIARKLLVNIPVYLGIILLLMALLRINDPARSYAGKNASEEQLDMIRASMGLDEPFLVQYTKFLASIPTLNFGDSWKYEGTSVRELLLKAVVPSLSFTVPTVIVSTLLGIVIALISAYFRGQAVDRLLMIFAVTGMSVSYVVYILFGQLYGASYPAQAGWGFQPFEISGYEAWIGGDGAFLRPGVWVQYCLLPVIIGVIVAMGYDTRFYRAVMVEETGRDYITTAVAKGATKPKIMFVHMLKNAMIPVITRVMATLPFLVAGSILMEVFFRIPGMGKTLIDGIQGGDFPVVQGFVAIFAVIFILSVILTDVLYAVVDPRVRLS